MDGLKESRRTRSKAAPKWTVEESLILVNEINAVESEWGATLPSFQKWQQIVENCNALEVNRNLNQCKRKWDSLLSDYRQAKHGEAPENGPLPVELLKCIDKCLNSRGKKNGDGAVEAEDKAEQVAMETDPDSDPDAQGRVTKLFFETGSKKQRPRMKRKKRRIETRNPWGYFTSTKVIKHEESTSIHENVENANTIVESTPEENNAETKEQTMAMMLWEKALQINAILEGNLADDVDYKLADLKNPEAVQTDCIRRQGDQLINCLGEISSNLKQLCDLIQKCN